MLLKFKNKHILAVDKMVKEAGLISGLIERIELDPKEAGGLILEIINLGKDYISIITITDSNGVDVTRQELLWNNVGIDKNEQIKSIIQNWYMTRYAVTYNTQAKEKIPMRVVKPVADVPKPPVAARSITGWTEPELVAEKDVDKSQIINSWKAHDDMPPVTKKDMDEQNYIPAKPKCPSKRIIRDDLSYMSGTYVCKKCGSSLQTKWVFFKGKGCIQPECDNYWKNK